MTVKSMERVRDDDGHFNLALSTSKLFTAQQACNEIPSNRLVV